MLSTLTKRTSDAVRGVTKATVHKWLGYFFIALVIVLSTIAVTNLLRVAWLKAEIAQLNTKMEAAADANSAMSETVANLRELRNLDSEVLSSLSERLGELTQHDTSLRNQLTLLETTNEKSRSYLDTAVDRDVARLLDQPLPERKNGRGDAAGAAADPVPATRDPDDDGQPKPRQ